MNIDPRIFAVEKLSDCVTGEAGAVTDGGAHAGSRTPVCSPGERVKQSKSPANSSSFPRKRESSLAVPQYNRWRVLSAPPLDSRFRGNDEAFLADYCLSPRRIFSAPVVICKNFSISSHDRERGA